MKKPTQDKIRELLSKEMVSDPGSLVFAELADYYRENGMVDEAIEMCLSGLKDHSDFVVGRLILGKAYVDKKEYELAEAEFKKVIEQDRNSKDGYKYLGEIYLCKDLLEEAADYLEKSLDIDPNDEEVKKTLEVIVDKMKQKAGIEEEPPLVPETETNIYRILQELNDTQGVIATMIISDGGLVVSEVEKGNVDSEEIGALVATIFKSAVNSTSKLRLGSFDRAIVEIGNGLIYMTKLGDLILTVMGKRTTRIGLLSVCVKKAVEKLEKILK